MLKEPNQSPRASTFNIQHLTFNIPRSPDPLEQPRPRASSLIPQDIPHPSSLKTSLIPHPSSLKTSLIPHPSSLKTFLIPQDDGARSARKNPNKAKGVTMTLPPCYQPPDDDERDQPVDPSRRSFLIGSAAATAGLLVSPLMGEAAVKS